MPSTKEKGEPFFASGYNTNREKLEPQPITPTQEQKGGSRKHPALKRQQRLLRLSAQHREEMLNKQQGEKCLEELKDQGVEDQMVSNEWKWMAKILKGDY